MSTVDPVLRDALHADVPLRGGARADWDDVLARAGVAYRGRPTAGETPKRRLPGRRAKLALLVALLAFACGGAAVAVGVDLLSQQERFHAAEPDDAERLGPLVEIASGDEWALIAWRSEAGVCVDFAIPGNSPFACGFPVRGAKPATDTSGAGPPTHAVAGFLSGGGLVGGDGKATIFGVAAPEVAAVRVELRDGRTVETKMYDAPPELDADLRFFLVRLALPPQRLGGESPVAAYVAYDRDGTIVERVGD